jgi:hypothetical protein
MGKHAIKTYRGTGMEKSDQLHVPGRFTLIESPRYLLDRRLGGPQNRSGRCGEKSYPCR